MVKGMKRSREQFLDKILDYLMLNGSATWKELFNSIDWRGNKTFFRDCLNHLLADGKIRRDEISHKHVVYSLNAEEQILDVMSNRFREWDSMFPKALYSIRKSKENLTHSQALEVYEGLICRELSNFLQTLEYWVRVDEKWQDLVKYGLMRYNVEFFSQLLAEMGRANPDAIKDALKGVHEKLAKCGINTRL
jgi:predicted transcriptional regulator